jgi:hypothetical protein
MSIQFIPLGLPISTSFAVSASVTIASANTPTTAALAAYAENLLGLPGDPYKEVDASPTLIVVPT